MHECVWTTGGEGDRSQRRELIISNSVHPPKEILARGQALSDKVSRFGSGWKFISLFGVVLALWIAFHAAAATQYEFDLYPFILMNPILSCIAGPQAPVIMMSQNRQEEKDRMRNENDYLTNLKAEMEMRSLHPKMDSLLEEQIETRFDTQATQFSLLKGINLKIDKGR